MPHLHGCGNFLFYPQLLIKCYPGNVGVTWVTDINDNNREYVTNKTSLNGLQLLT